MATIQKRAKKYTWEIFKVGTTLKDIEFVGTFVSGGSVQTAFNYFNGYIAESLYDGYYLCVRKDNHKYKFGAEVWR